MQQFDDSLDGSLLEILEDYIDEIELAICEEHKEHLNKVLAEIEAFKKSERWLSSDEADQNAFLTKVNNTVVNLPVKLQDCIQKMQKLKETIDSGNCRLAKLMLEAVRPILFGRDRLPSQGIIMDFREDWRNMSEFLKQQILAPELIMAIDEEKQLKQRKVVAQLENIKRRGCIIFEICSHFDSDYDHLRFTLEEIMDTMQNFNQIKEDYQNVETMLAHDNCSNFTIRCHKEYIEKMLRLCETEINDIKNCAVQPCPANDAQLLIGKRLMIHLKNVNAERHDKELDTLWQDIPLDFSPNELTSGSVNRNVM